MSSRGVINGSDYLLLLDGRYFILVMNTSISFERNIRDTSARETNNWKKGVLGMREWSIDVEGKLGWTYEDGQLDSRHTTTIGGNQVQIPAMATNDTLMELYFNQHKVYLGFVNFQTGAKAWEGYGYLTSCNIDAPMEDNSTVNMSFKGVNNPRISGVTNQGPADRPDPSHNYSHY